MNTPPRFWFHFFSILFIGGLLFIGFFPQYETIIPFVEIKEKSMFGSWVGTTTPWGARDAHALVEFKDKLFLLGGVNGNSVTEKESVEYWLAPHFNDIWVSDDGIVWSEVKKNAEFSPRRSISVFSTGDELVMLGGWSPIDGYNTGIWTSRDGMSWKRSTSTALFSPREGQIVRKKGNTYFLFGGVNFDTRTLFNDVWASDNGTEWRQIGISSWEPRYDHDVAILGEKFILVGGLQLGGDGFSDVWESLDGIFWNKITDNAPWGKRHGHTLFSLNNTLFIVSGWDILGDTGFSDMWESKDGILWKKTFDLPFLGREDHTEAIFRDTIVITGGMNGNWLWEDDYWRLPVLKK